MRKFTKLFCTAFLLLAGGVSASAQEDEIIDFDASFYHNWSEVSATATDNGEAGGGVVIGEEVAIGGTIWGNLTGAVPYLCYANITDYSELRFEGTPGATIRLMCNRLVDEGPIYEIKPTIPEDGKLTVAISDLKFLNGGTPCDFVCLQSIKVPASWAGGTMAATITSIKIVKPGDPLSIPKEELKNAINAAKMRTALGKTEESWSALQKAIEAAESALAATDATEETLTAAKTTVEDAMNGLVLAKGYTALTSDMFMNWENPENPVALNLATVLFQPTGQPYGDPSVKYFNYADISKYDKLIVGVIAGTPRIMLNRAEPLPEGSEGYDANGGAYVQITDAPVEGVVEVDLTQYEFAHLNAIKGANWQNVTVTDLLLYKEPVITDIEIAPADGDIAAAIAAAKAEIENKGDEVGNIFIHLAEGGTYTISSSIVGPSNIFVSCKGTGATIDASSLDGPFIAMANIEGSTNWTNVTVSIFGVNIKGLKKSLFSSTCKNYLIGEFMVINSVVEVADDVTVFDFTKGSAAQYFTLEECTFYAPTATSKAFYSSQGGQKITECDEDLRQSFIFTNNTFYNLTKGKNFFSHRQSNQKWYIYDVQNNIFVNCGKSGQTIKGMNGGQGGPNPTWIIKGNIFNFDDADTSADENTGDDAEPVQDSVAGVISFVDAAAGDFNGDFEPADGAQIVYMPGDPRWNYEIIVPVTHTWDFTAWSEATVTNLKAEAAKVTVTEDPENAGHTTCVNNDAIWSDHEKAEGKDCETYAASKDNCFWYFGGEIEPTANGEIVAELKGLQFFTDYGKNRSLAIAVNYPSTSLGTYAGPAYLWLGGGGKNIDCFTIKNVKAGTTISMGVESHKAGNARGVQLFVSDNGARGAQLVDPEGNEVAVPTDYTEQTWQVPAGDGVSDIIVYNTSGCHIYFIDAEIDETSTAIQTVTTTTMENGAWFDLQGRRVAQPTKGLYIINGKKVIVK